MTAEQLAAYAAQGFNRVALSREVLADLDTPLSVYLKLAKGPYSYLLESVHGGEKWGRYSIIGLPCQTVVKIAGQQIQVLEQGQCVEQLQHADPLTWISEFQARYQVPDTSPVARFNGGLVGYFGYDTVRYIEPRLGPNQARDTLQTPDILLMVSDELVVFDNLSGKLTLICHVDPVQPDAYAQGMARLQALTEGLAGAAPRPVAGVPQQIEEADFVTEFGQAEFEQSVATIKDYIMAGDAMQVVLSQRMHTPFTGAPLDVYRALRSLNPSPYMYFMDLDDFSVAGSSPEILVRLEEGEVTVRPIAGTRHRGATPEDDLALEQELLADPKEIAEHLMLIDLGRNDIGRVAKVGTVRLTDKMVVERYSHVMHIVSNVSGELQAGMDAMAVLRATFPAGTLSGAPKVRALEIIQELEPLKRNIYSGAVGYIGWNGNMDTAIAIRTAVIKDDVLYVQAGAGIVADSQPHLEWQETLNKGRAVFRAAALAARGLDVE